MASMKKSERAALAKAVELGVDFTPTMLGMALGHEHAKASSRVAPALRTLREAGFLSRREIKHNVVVYNVTPEGHAELASGAPIA